MGIERRGPDTIGARTVLAPWWTDHVRDTHRPCTTPNCDGARYVDGLCKRCWHVRIGRNSAADGAGTGLLTPSPAPAPVQTGRNQAADGAGDGTFKGGHLNDHPTPAPVDPEALEQEMANDYMREALEEEYDRYRPRAPVTCQRCGKPLQISTGDMVPERCQCDTLDIIIVDCCGLCGAALSDVDERLAPGCMNCRSDIREDD